MNRDKVMELVERLVVNAYRRGWHDGCETLIEDASEPLEPPHKDAMNEGCGDFMAKIGSEIESLELPADAEEEAFEDGKREGYANAVQDIDELTGGDGEYRCCVGAVDDRHCPDPEAMKRKIVERFETIPHVKEALEGLIREFEKFSRYGSPIAMSANEAMNRARAALSIIEGDRQ